MDKNEFQLYIFVRHDLAHLPIYFFLFCIDLIKKILGRTSELCQNDSGQTQSLGTLLSYIPRFSDLVSFVEHTLFYRTLYLEFYSKSKWLKYRPEPFYLDQDSSIS
jgi:hypothetical protein